ncbi:chromosomal replication initiator protein DnaA [Neisseria weaveri]|uniref:chromosomal replication initiator protein DnaA n=1 Tax=Neisseria weaveri TaxID=28091 RepID=UPI000D31717F|nr:chromosomal replication initiator protein DnaA [Neisseria weaveri]
MTLAEFWPLCLRRLSDTLTQQQFKNWIAPLTVGEENGIWVIYAKNQFACNMVKNQFANAIESVKGELAAGHVPLVFKIGVGKVFEMAAESAAEKSSGGVHTRPEDGGGSVGIAKTVDPASVLESKPESASAKDKDQTEAAEVVRVVDQPLSGNKKTVQDILAKHLNKLPPEIQNKNRPSENKTASKPQAEAAEEKKEQRYQQTNLAPDYTFETLVEGKGNHLAAAAAKSIAEKPGQNYNPFFLYGSTGLGKTHLVQAIGNELLKNKPNAKVRYMHSDDYIRSFMNAVRTNSYDVFKQQYKQYDLLIIDDIQFIKGKDRTMEEFFYLYNHFHNEKKQLILTCDVLPTKIEDMDDRLKSRFSWGLTLELEPPELEMRVAILQKKAEAAGVNLNEDAAFFIANLVRSNVRELEGAFNRVSASSRFLGKEIDIDLARNSLQDIVANSYKVITADLIIDATAKYYRVKISDILGKKRTRSIARPRQVAMSLTKELTNLSLPSIGDAFGGRDHTTIMHGIKAVAKLREEDPELAQDYEKLLIIIQN